MKIRDLLSTIHSSDRAENSIMQTITIAVSAILIAAGLVTAPGLINNARDNNATGDLANIAYAQEFAMGTGGKYISFDSDNPATADNLKDYLAAESENGSTVKFTTSGSVTGHRAIACNDNFYLLRDISSSTKVFYRASTSGLTSSDVSDLDIPLSVLASCPTILTDINDGAVAPPVGSPPFATYILADSRFATSVYVYSDDAASYVSAFPWAVGKTNQDTANITNTKLWVGTTSIPVTHQIDYVDIYSGEVGIDFTAVSADIQAAGFSMNQFLSDGWVSLTVDGIPNNYMHMTVAPVANSDGSDDDFVFNGAQKEVNGFTIFEQSPTTSLVEFQINSPLFNFSQGQPGGVSGSRDYFTSDFGPVVAAAYANVASGDFMTVDAIIVHASDGADYALCDSDCRVGYSGSTFQQVSRFYILGDMQTSALPYGSYTDAYANGDFVHEYAYTSGTNKAMAAGGVVEVIYNGVSSYFNITAIDNYAGGGIYDQNLIDND